MENNPFAHAFLALVLAYVIWLFNYLQVFIS